MSINELLLHALLYAERGWRVLPLHTTADKSLPGHCSCGRDCGKPGKHPRIRDWQTRATTNPDIIRDWWATWPNANIGIATGMGSGLIVVDDDQGNNPLGIPPTLTARTGRGYHYYLTHPGDSTYPNSEMGGGDIRADGGLVVAPPSAHQTGATYEWLDIDAVPIEAPETLITALRLRKDQSYKPGPPNPPSPPHGGGYAPYVRTALTGELERVREAITGERNKALNKAAYNLGRFVGGGALAEADTVSALLDAALGAGLGAEEARKTITSGMEAGKGKPRTVEPACKPAATPAPAPADTKRLNRINHTDTGNAECMAMLHGSDLRYCHTRKKWLEWDGSRWQIDEDGTAQRLAISTARARYQAAQEIGDLDVRKRAAAWAIGSESNGRIEASLKVAGILEPFRTTIRQFDTSPWLVATGGHTLDLQNGTARPAERRDNITMALGTTYTPGARCPRWEQFLTEVFHEADLVNYIQRAVGYSLTGDTREQVLFLLHGAGANGKSVFLDILTQLLGDYAGNASFDTFDAGRRNEATNDLAVLKGKRLVTVIETDEDRRLKEARVKSVTGGDSITCRFLYGEFFTYTPTYKIWIAMNHLPRIRGTDRGIWRRLRLIPFTRSFEGREDKTLRARLTDELPGILNWALAGLKQWQTSGLGTCTAVTHATEDYRKDSDQIGRWVDECCTLHPESQAQSTKAYQAYKQWCADNTEYAESQQKFGRRLRELGFNDMISGTTRKRYWIGIEIIEPEKRSDDRIGVNFGGTSCESDSHGEFPEKTTPIRSSDRPPRGVGSVGSGVKNDIPLIDAFYGALDVGDINQAGRLLIKLAAGDAATYRAARKALEQQTGKNNPG